MLCSWRDQVLRTNLLEGIVPEKDQERTDKSDVVCFENFVMVPWNADTS